MTYTPHHRCIGEGPPLLVLNGLGCANWFFSEQAEILADLRRFVLVDNRGMGGSPHVSEPYAIEDLARDALWLMDTLGHEQFEVLGYSMGGFVAQALCLLEPHRVSALMLLCSTSSGPGYKPLPEVTGDMLAESYKMKPRVMIEANLRMTMHPNFIKRQPERFSEILDLRLENLADLDQLLLQNQASRAFIEGPTRPLHTLSCPTLVLAGAQDRFVPPENAAILARTIPGGRSALVDESDHLFFIEKPREVSTHLRRFLESL